MLKTNKQRTNKLKLKLCKMIILKNIKNKKRKREIKLIKDRILIGR